MCNVDNHAVPLARAAKYSLLLCDNVNKDLVLANAVGLFGVESVRLEALQVSAAVFVHKLASVGPRAASSADSRYPKGANSYIH